MKETEIKSIDVWSLAKTLALFGFVFGALMGFGTALVIGFGLAMISSLVPEIASVGLGGVFIQAFFGTWVAVITAYTSFGLFTGLVFGLIYNFMAEKTGGIKFKS